METQTKQCQNCKIDFTIVPDDFAFYAKMGVPAPTFCPQCRIQRRLAHRNDRSLCRRECVLCQKKMLAIYSKDQPYIVYCPECWWGDDWDPQAYGVDYDFSKNFFEQYLVFKKTVPHEAMYQANFVNSEYANFGFNYKDCYLVMGGWDNEHVSYACQVNNTNESVDILTSSHLELCYESIQCSRSSKLRYCFACEDSSDLLLCTDCRGCVSCVGCVGLRNKQHCIFNEQYSKSEYEEKIKELNLGSHSGLEEVKKAFHVFALTVPYKFAHFRNTIDCTGENLSDSKNAIQSFDGRNLENVRYTFFLSEQKDTYDCSYVGKGGEMLNEICSSFGGSNQIVGIRTLFNRNSFYSEDCHNCNDIFGCIGLKKKSYCIFNKQYEKEEYESLVPKIIEQMTNVLYKDKMGRTYTFGDFWPIELGPFAYNETKAQELFPLTKDEALKQGYRWRDREDQHYQVSFTSENLPDAIVDVPDSIVNDIIGCANNGKFNDNCTKAFKILASEFAFYKQMNIPLPRLCPNCRHMERIRKQNPINLWHRSCMCDKDNHAHVGKCEVEFETSYIPDRPEIIYCEKCYQQEVV